eukprot:TRINITY_DN15837_c0_g1_i3.p1 TRINITY_DN15837_c0_g1~~TRINITY_DN15837_c0_g1_i3.p1  ORF type:complete len:743 (+),score=131.61 TRINITY_DN15837_c0_g1_i3:90-2318(+)
MYSVSASRSYSKMTVDPIYGPAAVQSRQFGARRMYDMCMVFRCKTSKNVQFEEGNLDEMAGRQLHRATPEAESKMQTWKMQRESILKSLQNCGLQINCFYSRDRDEIIVKIGASADKLRDTAAAMKYKLQLKPEYLSAYAEFRHDFPGTPQMNFTDRRLVSNLYQAQGDADYPSDDAIFSTVDKILIIHHIITSKDKDCAGINIANLLYQGEVLAYFPLHDNVKLQDLRKSKVDWLVMGQEFTAKVRDYFGDTITFYFLWMSFYAKWLLPLAVIGVALQVIDLVYRTPDNITALPFCILLSVWSVLLPHFWRRQEAKYAIVWGSHDTMEKLEPCRPEHHGEPRLNPVTTEVEPYYPWEERVWKYMTSLIVVAFSGVLMVTVILGLLYARHTMKNEVSYGIVTFQFLLAVCVEMMNSFLSLVTSWLTRRENHRTRSEHEHHMLAKTICFKTVNSYFALYYIAFFKSHGYLFGSSMKCLRNDCFLDLQSQLAIFVLFRMTVLNLFELMLPRVKHLWRTWNLNGKTVWEYVRGRSRMELADMSQPEQQAKKDPYESFADFDETLISHGYATLFAVSSPWVCFATLVGTIIEIFIDLRSVTDLKQRALPVKARNNDPWTTAFEVYGWLAAFTNVVLLIFGSHIFETWSFTDKITLFVFVEHSIFLVRLLIKSIFPETPKGVELLRLKQDHVVHRALENIKPESGQDYSMFRARSVRDLLLSSFRWLFSRFCAHPRSIAPEWHACVL